MTKSDTQCNEDRRDDETNAYTVSVQLRGPVRLISPPKQVNQRKSGKRVIKEPLASFPRREPLEFPTVD